jgi:1-hydroxycarotenoid 3,4-desaturase
MVKGKVIVVGAGVAGLVSALELARAGFEVQVFERQQTPGGKVRQVFAGGRPVDSGPTVFTMRWVFERIFGDAGKVFAHEVRLKPLSILARHAWTEKDRLDLFASVEESADAIGAFAGPREADGFRAFCSRARDVYQTLEEPFIRSPQPTPISLAFSAGLRGLGDMWRISPFSTLWSALEIISRIPGFGSFSGATRRIAGLHRSRRPRR